MDLKITGKFIKEQRKKKGLTQAELATKIMVSEKTISKWECGKGFPDTSLILPLCKALDINANELLSGKKLSKEEYQTKAESNLISLKATQLHLSKLLFAIEWVLVIMALVIFYAAILIACLVAVPTWGKVLLGVGAAAALVVAVYFSLIIENDVGFYECAHCHHKYIPKRSQSFFAPHMGRTKYMSCPECHKKSWQKKVLDK